MASTVCATYINTISSNNVTSVRGSILLTWINLQFLPADGAVVFAPRVIVLVCGSAVLIDAFGGKDKLFLVWKRASEDSS